MPVNVLLTCYESLWLISSCLVWNELVFIVMLISMNDSFFNMIAFFIGFRSNFTFVRLLFCNLDFVIPDTCLIGFKFTDWWEVLSYNRKAEAFQFQLYALDCRKTQEFYRSGFLTFMLIFFFRTYVSRQNYSFYSL